MNKQTYPIPPNCKFITQEVIDNKIITTFEPEEKEFKTGDIISTPRAIIILKNHVLDTINDCYVKLYNGVSERIEYNRNYNWSNETLMAATQQEKQRLLDALAKEGKQWNAGTLQIEDLKVEPKVGDCVKCFDNDIDGDDSIFYFVCGGFDKDGDPLEKNKYRLKNKEIQSDCNGFGYCVDGFIFTILTKDQFQKELSALGFEYNFDDDTISELRWRPKEEEEYYYIDSTFRASKTLNNWGTDIVRLSIGNYFKTKEECEEAITKIKNILK